MSFLSRIMPSAICCFHSNYHNDEDTQPSPLRSVQHTVARKPLPYAMINVPHEPEMADVYAFRRLFTQSPACPHEDTPIKSNPNRLQPRGSLDLDYTFNSGSPMPAAKKSSSIQRLSQNVKHKLSESRFSKNSSKIDVSVKSEDVEPRSANSSGAHGESAMLGMSARSTGLSDILGSRDGSIDRYDDDARSIRTPQLLSPADTIRVTHVDTRNDLSLASLRPSTTAVKSSDIAIKPHVSPKKRSLPISQDPEEIEFKDALQTNEQEPRDELLERIGMGIAGGIINPPNSEELKLLSTSVTKTDLAKKQHRARSSNPTDPETPQTIIKRRDSRLEREQDVSGGSKASDMRSTALLEVLDPALVEYIGRATPSRPLSSMIQERRSSRAKSVNDPNVREVDGDPAESIRDCRSCTEEASGDQLLPTKLSTQSQGYRSVHLFDMHISKRLASKSQATILSPSASENASRKSFDATSIIPASSMNSVNGTVKLSGIRAEHNRRPSDPHTRQLFERTGDATQPYWVRGGFSTRPKLMSQERDDASSSYTHDAGPPSSAGDVASFDGARSIKLNPNSIAIGGRAASYDFPSRRSVSIDRTISLSQGLPQRSLSTSHTQSSDLQHKATVIPTNYIDGAVDQSQSCTETEAQTDIPDNLARSTNQNPDIEIFETIAKKNIPAEGNIRHDWLNVDQKNGWNYDITRSYPPIDRRYSAVSMVAPDADAEANEESAAEMWNRAYRTASDDPKSPALLTPTGFDMNQLRRTSSVGTMRLKHQSEQPHDTPSTVVRRSQSVEPVVRKSVTQERDRTSPNFSKTLKKLSLLHLRGSKLSTTQNPAPKRLRKRSAPQLSKKSSFAASKHSVSSLLRPGHTPPLKELLGIWGAFPQDEREKRNGPAGEADSVLTRDFAVRTSTMKDALRPPQETTPSRELSAIQQALKALSFRVTKSAKRQGRSVSFPMSQSSSKTTRSRLNLLYRTKSSEWRGYMVGSGHRTSISASRLAEYPELETLPGDGLFTFQSRGPDQYQQHDGPTIDVYHASHNISALSPSNKLEQTPTKVSAPQVHTFWKPKSNASLGEPSRRTLTS